MQRYGVPSGETLDDSLLVAVIVMSRHSLPELRAALRSQIKTIGRDCQKLRTFVNDFLTRGLEHASAAVLSETSVTSANNVPETMDVGGEQETKEAPRLEPKVFELSSEVTGEQAELQHEARSTSQSGQSCLTAVQNKSAVGAPVNNLPRASLSIRDASSSILLAASVF